MQNETKPESPAAQLSRFKWRVKNLIDDGEIEPSEADATLERMLTRARLRREAVK